MTPGSSPRPRAAPVAENTPHRCPDDPERRLLALGGIHLFEERVPCRPVSVEPAGAVRDLGWPDALALKAETEGTAKVECAAVGFVVEIVAAVRIDIEVIGGEPEEIIPHERFPVRARLWDHRGRELEVGKFTVFEWACSGVLEVTNDRSSGEFGLCDTCYGMHRFRAVESGRGSIEVRLGRLRQTLSVRTGP
jgi:hypothetical protein